MMTMSDFIKKATEYKQQSSKTLFLISFIVGLLIIIAGYFTLQTIFNLIGLPATVVVIAILSYLIGRKL